MWNKYFKNSISFLIIVGILLMPYSYFFRTPRAEAQGLSGYISGLAPAITQLPLCKGKINKALKGLFNKNKGVGDVGPSGVDSPTESIDPGVDYGQSAFNNNNLYWGEIGGSIEDGTQLAIGGFDDLNVDARTDTRISGAGIGVSTDDTTGNLEDANIDALGTTNRIPVEVDPATKENIKKTLENTKAIKESTESIDTNDTCLKSIGRMVIKMLLQKITMSMVEWINNGFNGGPAFIQNPGKFFEDIAKNEILQFGVEISNPELFPFGKAFMQNTARAFNRKFTDNARYSLNEMIAQTNPDCGINENGQRISCDIAFQKDFSQGGWSAWDAMTQVPANNPMGFNMMASNELTKKLSGTNQSKAQDIRDSLKEAGGYLGDERCMDPKGVTKQEHDDALREISATKTTTTQQQYDPNSSSLGGGTNVSSYVEISESGLRRCNKWEYVTPGQMVAEAATEVMKYQSNNLLKAEDLNDAVAAILDALLNQFNTQIIQKGFAALDGTGADGSLIYDSSSMYGNYSTNQTELDFSAYQIEASNWLSQNPDFNIRTDLNQALVDEQRTYVDKLQKQNGLLPDLIKVIYQLDYCIPGPHPGWEDDSRTILNKALDTVKAETRESLKDNTTDQVSSAVKTVSQIGAAVVGLAVGATIGSGLAPIGTIVGAVVGLVAGGIVELISNAIDNDPDHLVRLYYAGVIGVYTGLHVDDKDKPKKNTLATNLENKQSVVDILNIVLEEYVDTIHDVFKLGILPYITKEAKTKYYEIKGYQQMIRNNEAKITSVKSMIIRLEGIKNEIDTLNGKLAVAQIDQEEYENQLIPWKSSFARISAELVSGDNIANADNRIKQIIDEKDYIYNDLLKGPNGCEKDLELARHSAPGPIPYQIYETKRAIYPASLLYDYNNLTNGQDIPDPWNSGYHNKMFGLNYSGVTVNKEPPAFLSSVYFIKDDVPGSKPGVYPCGGGSPDIIDGNPNKNGWTGSPTDSGMIVPDDATWMLHCRLGIDVPLENWNTALGSTSDPNTSGIFETMIGIY